MKVALFFLFVCAFQLMAINSEAQNANIVLRTNTLSVGQIISAIEEQTDYLVVFSTREVDTSREVHVKKQSGEVAAILKETFENTNIGYEFTKDYILLAPRKNLSENNVTQQTSVITGTVLDEKGEPVIGASIVVPGTSIGVITDLDGRFSIPTAVGSTIRISFIGYVTQNLTVRNTNLTIKLVEDSKILDEIVVVGYGTQRRRDLTGSVASVSNSQIRDIPVNSAAQAITGKLAGVQVTQTEGSPDADTKIRVRGGGSLTRDNSPLYIVDGFPVDNINDIAPTDIENIDVLKDASSTAIYGARGANGVVIITTKGGFEGKPKVNYNVYYGLKKMNDFFDVLDPYEYVYWQWEAQ
ncbi:MAG: TonB-dependent receptor plug domain-containing protein [Bacteroides sp.]|nr:TonB-dependent receptor plug domain-containing protein [Bacteroides sp.]